MTRTAITIAALAGLGLAGCSGPGSGQPAPFGPAEDLREVGCLIRDFTVDTGRAPARLADVAKNEPLYSKGYLAVKTGAIVVVWGVPMPAQGGEAAVIAYEKKAETEGGGVLLQDGTVKQMTAAEFQAAPRAKK